MFVLHSSSCCDVCLEGFSGSGDAAPHAIPCGHVFCKTCLEAVVPPRCPLCRKQYDPARLKKLHVDRPEGFEDPKETEFLQRIALLFDAPPDQLNILTEEVDGWLLDKAPEAAIAVRKARRAVDTHQRIRMERVQDLFTISTLRQDMDTLRATLDEDKRRAQLVEEGLLQAKDTLTIEVDRYKSELASLRSEIERRTLKNPLPPPPEPVSFPRYPPFDPKFAHPNGPFWHTQAMFPSSHAPPYPYGQTGQTSRLWPGSDRENQSHLHESSGAQRDRKGKSKDMPTQPSTLSGAYGINGSDASKPSQVNGIRSNGIFPPESSDKRNDQGFFSRRSPPPSIPTAPIVPEVSDLLKAGVDPFTLTAMLVPEYMNGFTEGFSSAVRPPEPSTSQTSSVETETLASSSKSTSSSERKKRREEKEREREERHERRRKREADRERREGRERAPGEHRRQEQRRERRTSTTNGRPPSTLEGSNPSTRAASRPSTRGGETNDEPPRSSRRPSDADPNHHPQSRRRDSLAEVLSDHQPRSRRASTAGPAAAVVTVPTPAAAAPTEHSSPTRVVRLLAPTPRVPIQLTEPRSESPESGQESPSRNSLSTISTWGTIDTSRSAHSNNSSLNIGEVHNFGRYPRDHQWTRPAATPYRPPALQLEPEESSDEDDGESEDENQITPSNRNPSQTANQTPTRNPSSALAPAVTSAPLGSVNRHHRAPSGAPPPDSNGARHRPQPRSASTHPAPSTAPAHAHLGSRHTQMIATYQNPTMHQQRPHTAAIPSGDGTGGQSGGPQGQDRRRAHGFSQSQPHIPSTHPRSQQPPPNANAGVTVNGHAPARARSGSSAGQVNVGPTAQNTSSASHARANPRPVRITRRTLDHQEHDSEDSDDDSEEEGQEEEHETPAANALGLVAAAPAPMTRSRNVSRHSNTIPIASPQGTHANALGLALPPPPPLQTGPIPISAPTPRPSNRQTEFLRTFSQS